MKPVLFILAMVGSGFAEPENDRAKLEETFRAQAAMPGGEYAAVVAARGDAAGFLALIQADAKLLDSPRGRLIEAELLLASGRKDEARERFKALADVAAKGDWGTGQPGYYPVELPGQMGEFLLGNNLAPYSYASGSHRDNWLLRRLIALDLMDEAAREFARIWEIHRAKGFGSLGLQFALDYAYFLKRTNRTDEALDVLMVPLRAINMDRNPIITYPQVSGEENRIAVRSLFHRGSVGVARKEFIRLAYGEFKNAGREDAMAGELRKQIDQGVNRARRVLAQVKLHAGDTDAALALELESIEKGGFNPVSAAYRRGLVFEAANKTDEAVLAFEQALATEPSPLDAPDADEQTSEMLHHSAYFHGTGVFGSTVLNRREVEERLQRLYAAQGRMDKVLELQFAQFDADENELEQLHYVEEMATRLKTAGQENRFTEWATNKLATAKSPRTKANLAWLLGDYPIAVRHAAEGYQGYYQERNSWRERFSKVDPKHELEYMRAIVERIPGDAVARLELLDLEDNVDGLEAIAALETLLVTESNLAFPHRIGPSNRVHFEGYYDLAYRLMRLYEKHDLLDKLRATGLRIAREEKPFADFANGYDDYGRNGRQEYGNACLALAVRHADAPAYQAELAAALETSRWVGARSQLARRIGKAPEPKTGGASPPWANLPPNTRVIVSCESVTCAAKSERFIYTGTSWGVAVYDATGAPVTRILLGHAVTHLVAADDQLWAGTEAGLFLVTAGKWTVAHEPIGEVVALGLDGEQLWIGVREQSDKSLMTLNRRTLAMRTFSAEEIGKERTTDFTRFEADGEYVWADNYYGLLRYERATDTWSKVENPGPRNPVNLIGIIDGQVWADVWINDELRHRPARLDRKTLELTPLKMRGKTKDRYDRMINTDLVFLGQHHGQPVFGGEGGYGGRFVVEENSNTIRRLREAENENKAEAISDPLPDLLSAISADAWPDGLRQGIRVSRFSERWPEDAVWAVVFDDTRKQDWLCVGAGLAVMPRDGSPLQHFGDKEGLTLGPMLDGVEMGGKLYFASAWYDHRGSLTVHEPETGVFTPWFLSDGMDSNKVVGLSVKEGKLDVRYGVEYPADDTENDLPPGQFDPATGRFTPGGKERITPVEGKRPAPAINGILPVLGGPAFRSYHHNGKTWHCGGRGLVIFPGTKPPALTIAPMRVKRVPSAIEISREEARKIKIPDRISADQLKEFVKHPNPHVRFRAVKATYAPLQIGAADEIAPMLVDAVNDKFPYVRAIAVWNLSQCENPAAIAPLREALDDTDPGIRAMATIAMAKLGEVPPLEHFQSIIDHSDRSEFRYDDDASFSVGASDYEVFTSLARHADRKIFEFLVTLPPPNLHYAEPVYPAFGESLRKHPDAAPVLLAVQDKERHGSWQTFVPSVFKHAGTEMLPILHEALTSGERVVRSNAARACGAIGDASSIPHLLRSLDLESGLSRASIVWALGELKAGEAVPRLIGLHQSERNAEKSRYEGAGLLAQNTVSISQGAYTTLSNLNTIESDWDELKTSSQPRPRDPTRDEELLTPDHILEAVRKIGGTGAQAFYRALAASTNTDDRIAAVQGLAEAEPGGRDENVVILRHLLADPVREVRTGAWVSLHSLGEPGFVKVLRESDPVEREELLSQMSRLPAPLLEPLRTDLETLSTNPAETERTRDFAESLLETLGAPR